MNNDAKHVFETTLAERMAEAVQVARQLGIGLEHFVAMSRMAWIVDDKRQQVDNVKPAS